MNELIDERNERLARVLSDPRVWEKPSPSPAEMPAALKASIATMEAEAEDAATLCDRLLVPPSSQWQERMQNHAGTRTVEVVRQLLARMPALVEWQPADALQATSIAVALSEVLDEQSYPPGHVVTVRAQALRDHAYVLSFLGRYAEALDSVRLAERELSQVHAYPHDLARLWLVKASALRMPRTSSTIFARAFTADNRTSPS